MTTKKSLSFDRLFFLVAQVSSFRNNILEELSRWKAVYRGGVTSGGSTV